MPDPISNAQQYFGVPETYGTAQDYFPGQQESPDDSAWRAKLEGRPALQPATSGDEFDAADYQIAQQTGDPFGVFQAAGALRTQAQANKIVQGLSAINPKMPDFLQRQNEILAQNPYALTDPRVLEMAKLNNSRAALAQPKTPSYKTDLAVQAAQSGVPVDQIRALRQPDGSYDELGLASAMGEAQRKAKAKGDEIPLNSADQKELLESANSLNDDVTDDEKVNWLKRHGVPDAAANTWFHNPSSQQYQMADAGVKNEKNQAFVNKVKTMANLGVKLPAKLQAMADLMTKGYSNVSAQPSQQSTVPSQPQAATIAPTEETPETPSDPFAALAQTIQQKQAEKNALKAKNEEIDNALWEKAKGDLLQKYGSAIDPDKTNSPEDIEGQLFNAIPEEEGDQVALVDSAGNPHSYKRVLQALGQDPRIQKLSRTSSLAPIVKTPQGRKFTVGAPINVK